MRWGKDRALRELATAWGEGRRLQSLLALASRFPDGSPQANTVEFLQRLASGQAPKPAEPGEPLSPKDARRELRDLSAFQKVDDLDSEGCTERVRSMLALSKGHPALGWLSQESEELLSAQARETPLQVAVLGVFSAGKSSLVNAILGAEILPTGVVPVTATLTVIRWGPEPSIQVVFRDGERRTLALEELATFADQRQEHDEGAPEVDRVVVEYPSELLKRITLYDTPGFNSGFELHELVTERVINQADAVLWVFDISKLGSEVERREIEHIRRSTGKAVALVNKVDTIRRPRYERKPEAWVAKIEADISEVRERSVFGELIDHWVPVSAHWIAERHERSGLEQLEATLRQFEARKEQIKAEARLLHLREAARRAMALEQLVAGEERDEEARLAEWLDAVRSWAAELRSDWQDEIRLSKRQARSAPPQCPADGRRVRSLVRSVIPEVDSGFGRDRGLSGASWTGRALAAWSALDGLAAVLACGASFSRAWEACLLRAQDLESREPRPMRRWREPSLSDVSERGSTLVELMLLGDVVVGEGIDAWVDRLEPAFAPDVASPSGFWSSPLLGPPRGIEEVLARLPCSRQVVSEVAQWRELRIVRSAERQLLVAPEARWAVALGFLRRRGPLERPLPQRSLDVAKRIEQRWFRALGARAGKDAAVAELRAGWGGAVAIASRSPQLPDPSADKLSRRARRLFTAARPALEASLAGRLPEHLALLQKRSWWGLARTALWAVLLSFLGAFAHVETKEHLDIDVGDPDSRAELATGLLRRPGLTEVDLPGLPDWPEIGEIGAWVGETWEGWMAKLKSMQGPPASQIEPNEPSPQPHQPPTPLSPLAKLELACAEDDPSACTGLGQLLLTGAGDVVADERAASVALAKACRIGDEGAPCLQGAVLARSLDAGAGGRDEAIQLFVLACDRGLVDGCVQAAGLVPRDEVGPWASTAVLWLARACRGGRPANCVTAAELYMASEQGTAPAVEACSLLLHGCEAPHPGSCERLAAMVLDDGLNGACPDDAPQALRSACFEGQDATCWAAARGLGCVVGARGVCGALLERACGRGVVEACDAEASRPRASLPAGIERPPAPL